uniref:Uncharacterized protein n=1 Tax=Lepeophtheirus salmonis TaxID=72036 RepID=A0A0K2V6Y5_LEPSM
MGVAEYFLLSIIFIFYKYFKLNSLCIFKRWREKIKKIIHICLRGVRRILF